MQASSGSHFLGVHSVLLPPLGAATIRPCPSCSSPPTTSKKRTNRPQCSSTVHLWLDFFPPLFMFLLFCAGICVWILAATSLPDSHLLFFLLQFCFDSCLIFILNIVIPTPTISKHESRSCLSDAGGGCLGRCRLPANRPPQRPLRWRRRMPRRVRRWVSRQRFYCVSLCSVSRGDIAFGVPAFLRIERGPASPPCLLCALLPAPFLGAAAPAARRFSLLLTARSGMRRGKLWHGGARQRGENEGVRCWYRF